MADLAHELEAPYVEPPPTQDDLPCDDGEPMETARHRQQMNLLIDALHTWLDARPDGYAGGNMFVYFSLEQTRRNDFRGPDFFLALNVPKGERKSWVVWEEGRGPDLVVELLSETTAEHDKTTKKAIYQDRLRVPEYYWYDPWNPDDFAGFELIGGRYRPLQQDHRGRLISPLTGLALARWQGTYGEVTTTWLRWESVEGELLPTRDEAAERRADAAAHRADDAEQRAEDAEHRADAEAQRAAAAEAEAARLRALLERRDA
jgi:Uma2 family endonuclease